MKVELGDLKKDIVINDGDIVIFKGYTHLVKSVGHGFSLINMEQSDGSNLSNLANYAYFTITDKIKNGEMFHFSKDEYKLKIERKEGN